MIIGSAGHIDHGKTALVKALTGIDADRLKEEKARGITIDLGYAYTPLPNGDVLGFVDVPGHEKFIHNMLAGATGIDFVLLVVAADDGPMPQTREHLHILDLLGLERGVVALTKADRVSAQRLAEARAEIAALLGGSSLEGSDIYPVSALTGTGIPALRERLDAEAQTLHQRSASGHFRLAADRCFTLSGIGTVVTGTVFSGTVAVGDKLVLSPSGIPVRVRSIHAQDRAAQTGVAGQRCALNLVGSGFDKAAVARGDWVLAGPLHAPVTRLDVRLRVLASEDKPLRHWTPVHVHLGATDVTGRVSVLEGEVVAPGMDALVQLVLDKPIGALHGDRFIVRDQSASRTLGGGRVLDSFPPARGRRTSARIELLRALESGAPAGALQAMLQASASGVDLRRFALNWNLRENEARALWSSLPMRMVEEGETAIGFSPAVWAVLKQRLLDTLTAEHARVPDMLGVDRERLRRMTAPTLSRTAFLALTDELLATDSVRASGLWLHLPGHSVTLLAHEEKLWAKVRPLLDTVPYQPPRVRDIAKALDVDERAMRLVMQRLARQGEVFQVAHDHFFTREAVAALATIARKLAEDDALEAAAFRDRIGVGRKLAIQILEFFDRVGFTRRARDSHKLRHADLFAS
ncbi:selenocysteine-specific translation factor [Sulfuriferula plumbiphila]|uniref:Selenocysteine-specific elongation factor n=1 Tax=Sulfuriferula plumbiphila TaxID=171865 RepID=A0A512LB54_9PROT|nr:selenocysteine-specific translation elongation factor [Sulfuriferula plumbiphila]BBP04323.1 selenocysteine-specific translation factor [Sulfuriferula plumbiphila]GEP31707.1 selenocysteine-specific translation factor [Sulfuriferula plumbiphila]